MNSLFLANTRTFWLLALVLLFAMQLLPGTPYWLFLFPLLFIFSLSSVCCPQVSLYFIVFSHSFTGIIRIKDQGSLFLAGFGTVLIVIFIIGIISRYLLTAFNIKSVKQDKNSWLNKIIFIIWFSLFAIILLNIFYYWSGIFTFAMKIREYILPISIFPLVVYAFSGDPSKARSLLIWLLLGSSIVAMLNIIHYFFGLPIPTPRWITHFDASTGLSTDVIEYRQIVGGIMMPRMKHLLGLSGAGAGAAYYATMALMGYGLSIGQELKNKSYLFICILVNIIAAFFALSFSTVVVFICVVGYLIISKKKKGILSYVRMFFLFIFTFLLVVIISPSLPKLGFSGYLINNLVNRVLPMVSSFDQIIFGVGLGLKSGGLVGLADLPVKSIKYKYLTDQWFFVVLYQMGIIGFILTISVFIVPLIASIRSYRYIYNCDRQISLSAGILVSGFVGFSHGAAPIERLFSMPMIVAISVIVISSKYYMDNKISTTVVA